MYSRILQELEQLMINLAVFIMAVMIVVVCCTGAIVGVICFAYVVNEVIQYVF